MSRNERRSNLRRQALRNEEGQTEEISVTHQEIWSAPLPHPAFLVKFNEAHPDAADRIIRMAEKEQENRHVLERMWMEGGHRSFRRGQIMAFVLVLVLAVGSFKLILDDKDAIGIAVIIADIAGLCGVFVYGHKKNQREREKRRPPEDV